MYASWSNVRASSMSMRAYQVPSGVKVATSSSEASAVPAASAVPRRRRSDASQTASGQRKNLSATAAPMVRPVRGLRAVPVPPRQREQKRQNRREV